VDPELQQALAQFEGRLNARIDGVETRLRSYIEERSEALSAHVEERSEALKAYVEERGETTETKLLTAFHNWAQTFEVRARGTSAAVREFDERLGMIEERLAKIERSRN
jgi:DNA anti-recombination protein RmuC